MRKYKKKSPARKYRTKKRKYARRKATVRRLPMGFPDRLRTRLNYQIGRTYGGGTLPADSFSAIFYKINSVFDPVYAVGGEQPPLYDNYASVYNRWRVNKCTVTARIQSYSTVPIQCVLIAAYDPLTNSPSFPNSPTVYNQWALPSTHRSKIKTLNTIVGGSGCQTVLKKTFYPGRIVGKDYYTSVNYEGQAGDDPSKEVVGELLLIPQSTGTEAWGCWVQIQIDYEVIWFNRNVLEVADID